VGGEKFTISHRFIETTDIYWYIFELGLVRRLPRVLFLAGEEGLFVLNPSPLRRMEC